MNQVRRSWNHFRETIRRSPGKAENTNTLENMVLLQIHVEKIFTAPHTLRIFSWCTSLGFPRNRIWKQSNFLQAVLKLKVFSGNIVPCLTMSLSLLRKMTSNTIHYIMRIEIFFFNERSVWAQKPYLNTKKSSGNAEKKIITEMIVPYANSQQRSFYYFSDFVWKFDVIVWATLQTTFENK